MTCSLFMTRFLPVCCFPNAGAPETNREAQSGTMNRAALRRAVSGRQSGNEGQAASTGELIARAAAVHCVLTCMTSMTSMLAHPACPAEAVLPGG
jgi:hypothetical protein